MSDDARLVAVLFAVVGLFGLPVACGSSHLGTLGTGGTTGGGAVGDAGFGPAGSGGAAARAGSGGAVGGFGAFGGDVGGYGGLAGAGPYGGYGGNTGDAGAPGTGGTFVRGACGTHRAFGPTLTVQTAAPQDGTYDGPAVVETSSTAQLTIYFEPSSAGGAPDGGPATGGGPDGSAPSGMGFHARLSALGALPLFPPGAKVWLSKTPAGNEGWSSYFGPVPWAITVRDGPGGTILIGAARNLLDSVSAPIAIGAVTAVCTAATPDFCGSGTGTIYSDVALEGDNPVIASDSVPTMVTLGGVLFSANVTAQQQVGTNYTSMCDGYAPNGIAVDLQAADLPSRIAALEVGHPPFCGEGNEPRQSVSFTLTGAASDTAFEGPVSFTAASSLTDIFAVAGIVPTNGQQPTFTVSGDPSRLLPESYVGRQLWLSHPDGNMFALRSAQGGDLLLAQVLVTPPIDAATRARISHVLGFDLTPQERCPYAPGTDGVLQSLWDAVVASSPATTVKSGTTRIVPVSGTGYQIAIWGEGTFVATVHPAPAL